jgi:hypothetical protein
MAKTGRWLVLLCPILDGCAVSRPHNRDARLTGEWAITTVQQAGGRTGTAWIGRVYFDERIPQITGASQVPFSLPMAVGRAYVDRRVFVEDVDGTSRGDFRFDPLGDFAEELVAERVGDTIRMILAPSLIGGRVEFTGTMTADTVIGTWLKPGHPGPPRRGHFRMWPISVDEFADSARVRAVRSRRTMPTEFLADTLIRR